MTKQKKEPRPDRIIKATDLRPWNLGHCGQTECVKVSLSQGALFKDDTHYAIQAQSGQCNETVQEFRGRKKPPLQEEFFQESQASSVFVSPGPGMEQHNRGPHSLIHSLTRGYTSTHS